MLIFLHFFVFALQAAMEQTGRQTNVKLVFLWFWTISIEESFLCIDLLSPPGEPSEWRR